MNATLRRLSTVVLVMFLALMVSTSWIQFVAAGELNDHPRNVRGIYSALARDRGPIVVSGGEAVATSVPVDDNFKYQRTYSEGDAGAASVYAPVTGYFAINGTVTGMERYANSYLAGEDDSLWLDRLQNLITGEEAQGSSVELTIDPKVQKAAWDALGDNIGAAVALDPKTGAILAMVSKPSYDPNALAVHDAAEVTATSTALINDKPQVNSIDGEERFSPYGPTINRAINATYPPGSTFKLLTTAAAIEYNGITPDTSIPAEDVYQLPGTTGEGGMVQNYGGTSCDPSGSMLLKDALRISCNTAFLALANEVGKDGMQQMFQDFGFTESIDIPMSTSVGAYPGLSDTATDDSAARIALSGMGQGDLRMTPLQVAMLSAAIANDGDLMEPYLIQSVRDSDLELVSQTKPNRYKSPFSSSTADALTEMMVTVVNDGSGTGAQISGVEVAGKTGTAEDDPRSPTLWFTSFAPADDPEVAVAVVLENEGQSTDESTGGALASPIAAQIMQAAISK
ncbi:peptidoglycan glycosyltransferase [Promicromonospora umidemergens]|uniref:Penicillin-binding transpeptidase domain-containing protein n=1 Tax=Promicromonospora umidemergens TaxID=629679 RepID=A0ABP8XTB6_9MICO|nr:penicillin-binding protein 2 [Promicromonospora umidemergens]MCP2285345.1 peptidoglycan glycosyltransferase [Promicromonospora umidemergens]